MTNPVTDWSALPLVLTLEQVLTILQISRGTFERQHRAGAFPIPEVEPRVSRCYRFSRERVKAWIEGQGQTRAWRKGAA